MTVRVSKPAFNIREALSALKRKIGIKGGELMAAETVDDVHTLINPNGFRNRVINGDFNVWQRGTSGFGLTSYAADRWYGMTGTTGTLSQQLFPAGQTDVPGEPRCYMRFDKTGTGDYSMFGQKIEDVRTFAGKTCTLSFYAKDSVSGLIGVNITQFYDSASGSSSAGTQLLPITTSWKKYVVTFSLPSIVGKTIGANSYLRLDFTPINGLAATVHYTDIARVQLEEGSVATPFEVRPYGTELALCQRFYQNSFLSGNVPGVSTDRKDAMHVLSWSDGNCMGFSYYTPMRAAPTVTLRPDSGTTSGYISMSSGNVVGVATFISQSHVSYITTVSGVATSYARFTWEATAEL